MAGIAAKHTSKGRVDKITGLDPNRNGFNINQSVTRLASGDARFVEVKRSKILCSWSFSCCVLQVYHSNGGKLGIMEHLVDSDKYISKSDTSCQNKISTAIFR